MRNDCQIRTSSAALPCRNLLWAVSPESNEKAGAWSFNSMQCEAQARPLYWGSDFSAALMNDTLWPSSLGPRAKGASGIPPYAACTTRHMPRCLIHFSEATGAAAHPYYTLPPPSLRSHSVGLNLASTSSAAPHSSHVTPNVLHRLVCCFCDASILVSIQTRECVRVGVTRRPCECTDGRASLRERERERERNE